VPQEPGRELSERGERGVSPALGRNRSERLWSVLLTETPKGTHRVREVPSERFIRSIRRVRQKRRLLEPSPRCLHKLSEAARSDHPERTDGCNRRAQDNGCERGHGSEPL
jgi:hypothetical protein